MKNIFFIYPNPSKSNPRGIRVNNIVQKLRLIAPNDNYNLLSFSENYNEDDSHYKKVNSYNSIYLLFRYLGVLKFGRKIFKMARILDPYVFIHFVIKIDIKWRIRRLDIKDCVFVVVVSPFSNYLLVPWLKKKYPNAKIICDIGDPLYKNSARERDEIITKKIERDALTHVDNIIVTNGETSELLAGEYNVNDERIHVIPQGVDVDLIEKAEKIVKHEEIGTLVYAGSFYERLRSPKALFGYLTSQEKFKIHIYGGKIGQNNEHIIYEGKREQEDLFIEIQSKQIIVYIDNKFGIQTSGKIYEVLSFKKPILFIKGKENSPPFLLAQEYPNVFFAEDTPKSIGEALSQIKCGTEIRFLENRNRHSWLSRAESYIHVINS